MQTPKADLRENILLAARRLFLTQGYKRTSMAQIAHGAGMAVGNIYHYYPGKDKIFCAVVAPFFKAFEAYRKEAGRQAYKNLDVFKYQSYFHSMKHLVISLVLPYRDELRLLMCEAEGTSLSHAFDRIIAQQGEDGMDYIKRMKMLYPEINDNITPAFVRVLCMLWKEVTKEIVVNRNLNGEETDALISDYVKFDIGGWKQLMDIR